MKFTYYIEERKKNDKVKRTEVVDERELIELKDKYVLSGDLIWENDKQKKREKYLCIELDKPLEITGNVIIHGYINTIRPLKVKGLYKVGDRYEVT